MEREFFCCNSMCEQHVKILYGGDSLVVEKDGKRHKYRQHQYRDREGKVIWFCDVCHNAISKVIG